MNKYLLLTAVLVLSGAAYWLWQREEATNRIIINPKDRAQVALGEAVYRRECATCHGENLEGQPNWQIRNEEGRLPAPPHDETGHTWHHPDTQLVELTAKGPAAFVGDGYQSDMPAYEGILTEAETHAVLAFIKSRWPLEIQERQAEITRRAAAAQD